MAQKINCPKEVNLEWLRNFSSIDFYADELREGGEISLFIDMSNVTFCTPAGLCGLHEIIRSTLGAVSVSPPINRNAYRYLQRIGFFDNLKIFINKDFVSHSASGRFKASRYTQL